MFARGSGKRAGSVKGSAISPMFVPVISVLVVFVAATLLPASPRLLPDASAKPSGGSGSRVQLAFVGDVLLASRVGQLMDEKGVDRPWAEVAPVLRAADLAICNLECAVGTTGQPEAEKEWTFRAKPSALEGLVRAGVDVVGLANNHVLDYGRHCLLETLEHLDRANIPHVGAGRDLQEAKKPYITEINGIKIGILGLSMLVPKGWGAAPEAAGVFSGFRSDWLPAVRDLASRVDFTVVFVHWGEERADHPREKERLVAARLLEAGADLIIGHHPHVWQGLDRRPSALIAYSLGNFVFTSRPEFPQQQMTGILLVNLTKEGIADVQVVPAEIRYGETVTLRGKKAEEMWQRLDRLSAPFGTYVTEEGRVERAPFRDVRDHWARDTIRKMATLGLLKGYEDGAFHPDTATTHAHLMAMLVRALKLPVPADPSTAGAKRDTTGGAKPDSGGQVSHWVEPYLQAGAAAGLWPWQQPFPNDQPIPRWRAARLLARALAVRGARPSPDAAISLTDLAAAPDEARTDVALVLQAGIMTGYADGTFRPTAHLSRAEAAVVVWRLLEVTAPTPAVGP